MATPMPAASKLSSPFAALALCLSSPAALQAQIASPSNAGGNAGNNTSGSSSTPISTPNFSPATVVPVVSGVSVSPTGTVTAPPAVVSAVDTAVRTTVTTAQASILAPVTTATAPAPLTGPQSLVPDVSVAVSGGTQQLVPLVGVSTRVAPLVSPGSVITVTRTASGSTGNITVLDGQVQVSAAGQTVPLATTPANQVAIVQFAAVAIAAGFSPASISLGGQLVSIGAPVPQALQLMASLQGLAVQPDLTALATGITAFNTIVDTASPAVLSTLAENAVFSAASTTLRNARAALASAI